MLKTDIIQKAIVRKEDGKVLILRRSNTDTRRPLQWDLPGGFLDDNEELIEGIEREVKEEAGIQVKQTHLIYSQTEHRKWDGGEANAVFLIYSTIANKEEVKLSFEHNDYKWVDLSEILNIFEYKTHLDIINYIIDNQLAL